MVGISHIIKLMQYTASINFREKGVEVMFERDFEVVFD